MEKILDVAQYIFDKYKAVTGCVVNEMKLHKLLYFSQRESFAITGNPLFEGDLQGWKFGPASPQVRLYYSNECGILVETNAVADETAYILNNVILEYGALATWKLSALSHKEISWINARKGLAPHQNGTKNLRLEDIRDDAKKVRPYDHVWDMYYDEFDDLDKEETNQLA